LIPSICPGQLVKLSQRAIFAQPSCSEAGFWGVSSALGSEEYHVREIRHGRRRVSGRWEVPEFEAGMSLKTDSGYRLHARKGL